MPNVASAGERPVAQQPQRDAATARPAPVAAPQTTKAKPRRLTSKEPTELAALLDRIDALERERAALYVSLSAPAVRRSGSAVEAARSRLVKVEAELSELTERWETFETIATQR